MSKAPEDFLGVLNTRSQDIFRKIVERYLETGTPVGSRDLSRLLSVGLSPASVRNVMADLEDLGLIAAPHTSAGRQPTQQGLRFFVDAMLEVGAVDEREKSQIARQIAGQAAGRQGRGSAHRSLDALWRPQPWRRRRHLRQIPRHGAAPPRIRPPRRQSGHGDSGRVRTGRSKTASCRCRPASPLRRSPRRPTISPISSRAAPLAEARTLIREQHKQSLAALDELTRSLVETGLATLSEGSTPQSPTVIVRGRANLLNDTMQSEELSRMRRLFDELERQEGLIELLGDADKAEGVRIFIGSENKLFSLSGSSVILSPYKDANEKIIGVLGVIGPTRLNYSRIVPVVDYTAQVISQMMARKKG